jgi:hypothetical protein
MLRAQWVAVVAASAALTALPLRAEAAAPVIEVPGVRAATEVIVRHGQQKLLVKSLTVSHAHEVDVRATCRRCLRLPGPKPRELEPARGLVRFTGLNWVLDDGLHVRVFVTAADATGRYLVLGPAKPLGRHRLVIEKSGCLKQGKPVACTDESSPSPSTPPLAAAFPETVGGDTETWTDYQSAGGLGGSLIHAGQTVDVSCAVRGFAVADGNTWWYRIASNPWNNAYYASADAFYNNGQTSGSLVNTPFVDPAVPVCAG